MITGLEDSDSKIRGIRLGVDDFITKPFNIFELKARAASLIKLKQYTDQLENAESILFSLALTVEAKDPNTQGHCNRLANYGMLLGEEIGLEEHELRTVRRGGILHDIGKLAITDSILLKPGPLTKEEYKIIQQHPAEGERICKPLQTMNDVLPVIRHHQERFDGSGYPDIGNTWTPNIVSQMIAIADTYDAMRCRRPYRRPSSEKTIRDILVKEKGLSFNPFLVDNFISVLSRKQIRPC